MSGGNCPETPRQKMIGMMYLFLTAMLALNVSGELLNAFILVDQSILQAKESVESKNKVLYWDFDAAKEANPAKVTKSWNDAKLIHEKADSLVNHIQELKILFVQKVDGPEATPADYTSKDNQDIAGQLMITEKKEGRSIELKLKFQEFRELLLGYVSEVDSTLRNTINKALATDPPPMQDNVQKSWQSEKFEHLPLSASIALMSQLQSAVRNMESDVVRYLLTKLDEGTFKFNKVVPLIIPRSSYVLAGDEYYAEIMMAARDTTQDPEVTINGTKLTSVEGKGILKIPATSTGEKSWSGKIEVMGPEGILSYPISGSYLVSKPNVVISPVKMNVFYEGVENPVEISVPGIPSENLRVNITNARSVKKGNQYIVSPNPGSSGGESVISVVAKVNNKDQSLGRQKFRIKRVPNPIAKVGGISEGNMNKSLLLAQMGVVAEMESFDFDLVWKISKFTVSTTRGGYQVDESSDSNLLNEKQKDLIKSTGRGQKIYFENIRAVGPGGTIRSLGSITITVD